MDNLFYLKTKLIKINVWTELKVILNEENAWKYWIKTIDKVWLYFKNEKWEYKSIIVDADLTTDEKIVKEWEIWILQDIYEKYNILEKEYIWIYIVKKNILSIEAIRKKILWWILNEKEIYSLFNAINLWKISDILLTYYISSNFLVPTNKYELFLRTKISAELWKKLEINWNSGIKYCIWWIPWNETTMIIAPILSWLWILYPKTFSKAITSPAATWECVDVLMNINYDVKDLKNLLSKNWVFLARSKNLNFAPVNDKIIKLSYPISLEWYSQMVSSIVAKMYAWGIKNCIVDIPIWKTAKIKSKKIWKHVKKYFLYLGKKLNINIKVIFTNWDQPIGNWIWAKLQVRDVLRILQLKQNRPLDLEKKALFLSAKLYQLVNKNIWYKKALEIVKKELYSWNAFEQFKIIVKNQWQKIKKIESEQVFTEIESDIILSKKQWKIHEFNLKNISYLSRILWCPNDYDSWIYFYKKKWDLIEKWEKIFKIYSSSKERIKLALDYLKENIIIKY